MESGGRLSDCSLFTMCWISSVLKMWNSLQIVLHNMCWFCTERSLKCEIWEQRTCIWMICFYFLCCNCSANHESFNTASNGRAVTSFVSMKSKERTVPVYYTRTSFINTIMVRTRTGKNFLKPGTWWGWRSFKCMVSPSQKPWRKCIRIGVIWRFCLQHLICCSTSATQLKVVGRGHKSGNWCKKIERTAFNYFAQNAVLENVFTLSE